MAKKNQEGIQDRVVGVVESKIKVTQLHKNDILYKCSSCQYAGIFGDATFCPGCAGRLGWKVGQR